MWRQRKEKIPATPNLVCTDTTSKVPIKTDAEAGDFKTSKPIQIRFEKDKGEALVVPVNDSSSPKLQELVSACSPASFGRGGEDVFDESYRKASKLDAEKFISSFCPYTTWDH